MRPFLQKENERLKQEATNQEHEVCYLFYDGLAYDPEAFPTEGEGEARAGGGGQSGARGMLPLLWRIGVRF